MALFQKDEFMRPVTLAALAAIVVIVIVLRIQNSPQQNPTNMLSEEEFGKLVDALYPSEEQLQNLSLISLTTRERKSESIHVLTRDSAALQGYISKPEGSGPFPYIVIVPDPFIDASPIEVSQTLGELYAATLRAAVLVIETRSTHRGVDDVTDVIATLDWQAKVAEIHDQPQTIVGIGYGAWLIAQAAKTVQPERVAYLSPIFDLHTENIRATVRNTFISESDCENIAAEEACFANLAAVTLPHVPTYSQFTSNELIERQNDFDMLQKANLSAHVTDTIENDESLRLALIQVNSSALTHSLRFFTTWWNVEKNEDVQQ